MQNIKIIRENVLAFLLSKDDRYLISKYLRIKSIWSLAFFYWIQFERNVKYFYRNI